MSIIFGVRKPDGALVSGSELYQLARATSRYAPDALVVSHHENVGMGFQAYNTHRRSTLESGPVSDLSKNLLGYDGRLDNYRELCRMLQSEPEASSDSQIVLASFERWGTECFSRLIGDWALALWCAREQTLYLARDHAGARSLYFENRNGTVTWSTYLDTICSQRPAFELDLDYAALYVANRPTRDLTPYKGVRSVPPAHYIAIHGDRCIAHVHWRWMRKTILRYKTDREYEEHFLDAFGTAVERRSGPGAPIVAHLSGGMDSTSIVCMSDHRRRTLDRNGQLLDSLSFYDDSEPTLDDKPYYTLVQSRRKKMGIQINLQFGDRTFEPHDSSRGVYLLPGSDSSTIEREGTVARALEAGHYRTIISGMGGDEVLGGVPTGLPELATHLMTARMKLLLSQGVAWSLVSRGSLASLLVETAGYAYDLYCPPHFGKTSAVPWISASFQKRYQHLLRHDVTEGNRLGMLPNNVDNGLAWWSIIDSLPHLDHRILTRTEYCYPYLDKDLVDYLFSVPRDQIVRPGQRRSLMRRSLHGIVPKEILERKRKAFQLRAPLATFRNVHSKIERLLAEAILCDYGIVDRDALLAALKLLQQGEDTRWRQGLMRVINLELWLRSMNFSHSRLQIHQDMFQTTGATNSA